LTAVAERDTAALNRAWGSPPGVIGFFSAVNHKQVGIRFIVTAFVFLLVGGLEAILIRVQLIRPNNDFLGPEAYNQLFTMHGTTMMFLFAIPILEGIAMYLTPLAVGTRDMPFPRLNAFGYWCFVFGGILLNWSFVTGSIPEGGWFAYTPLTGPDFTPNTSMDYWLLGVTFVEIAGIVGALEIVVLILRQRAPGMSLTRIPLLVWSIFVMAGLMLFAFPAVIASSLMLELERKLGAPFYTPDLGGNPLLWQHLFWIFGHPEVYIMLLPATGIVSAIVAVHVGRKIVGYEMVVAALVAIGVLSIGLWVHHMYAAGIPVLAQSFFAVASMMIAIPSGIQIFAWLATMLRGVPRWTTPMLYVAGFVFTFVAGGITGVMVASAPFDWQVHDSFFVVAHFHYVILGGVLFPILGGLHHWFPKMRGRMPNEAAGKVSFALVFVGFHVTFFVQHDLGFRGMPRRVYTYDDQLGWNWLNLVSSLGSFVLGLGVLVFGANLLHAWYRGRPATSDPWGGDGLEWATDSPPAQYNFHEMPVVASRAPLWEPAQQLDVAVEEAVSALRVPDEGRREVLITTPVMGDRPAVAVLPGPSAWPFFTALGIAVALVGVLVDSVFLGVVGTAGAIVALVAWTAPDRPPARSEHRELGPPSLEALGRRPQGWFGLFFGLISAGLVFLGVVYAYFYLSVTADDWPPPGFPSPGFGHPVAAIALALVGAAAGTFVGRSARWGTTTAAYGWSAVALAAGVGAALVGMDSIRAAPFSIDDHGYAAAVVTLLGYEVVIAATAAMVTAVGIWHLRRAWDLHRARAVSAVVALLWQYAALTIIVARAVVTFWPRLR
jgi:cytochrome c oxidase subunit I+III